MASIRISVSALCMVPPKSLIHSRSKIPAVHRDALTSEEACAIRREENRHTYQFLGLAESTHRRRHQDFVSSCSSHDQLSVQFRCEHAGNDGVDSNPIVRPFASEASCQR